MVDQLGLKLASDAATKLVLDSTGGRIVALAATGHIRGMTAGMCIIDEGAWVPTSVMQGSVLPMLAAVPGGGCLVSATTPAGQRGWFYEWYEMGGSEYDRWMIPYTQVKRISKEYAASYKASVSRQVWAAELRNALLLRRIRRWSLESGPGRRNVPRRCPLRCPFPAAGSLGESGGMTNAPAGSAGALRGCSSTVRRF